MAKYECNFGYRESIFKKELKDKFFITHVTFQLQKYSPETYFPQVHYGAIQDKIVEKYGEKKLDIVLTPGIVAETIAQIREGKLPNRKEL